MNFATFFGLLKTFDVFKCLLFNFSEFNFVSLLKTFDVFKFNLPLIPCKIGEALIKNI